MSATAVRGAAPAGSVVAPGRRRRARHWWTVVAVLAVATLAVAVVSLVVGERVHPLGDVLRVLTGQDVPGASFTVGRLRLPRVLTGALAGVAFGIGGVIFQTMLRNPLASPDIIGITAGSSAAAVLSITSVGLAGAAVPVVSVVAGVGVAAAIYALAWRRGVHGARFVLVGIGVGAMLQSVVSYALTRANVYDVADALRWLSGSLNSAFWDGVPQLAVPVLVLAPVAVVLARRLAALQLGDELAAGLGVRPDRARLGLIVVAVGLISAATASTGPIAFVAFLSGPLAHRLVRGTGSLLVPAALVGALLVLVADLAGQHLVGTRFPVGVVTGVVGAPYLLWLLARSNRSGGTL
ncbi:FecCD family ABC transporter permease [Cellulomonas sp. 179-A 9B4 NHS]|uniref:FecCD family ABC transporter permease n=1 Tax=Cellulomonas sp. 179-A 9B4 NHS TaxID=3142379 RepID=UPI0039A2F99C